MSHDFTFIRAGVRFKAYVEQDDISDAPWERADGHGPVRTQSRGWGHISKYPGERVLHTTRHTVWLYDWQAACRLARKDGWNAEPYDAPNRIQRAVQADFDYLRRWLQDDWWYVGVRVCREGQYEGRYANTLWGIESDADDYIREVAEELADEILLPALNEWRAHLRERREHRNLERLARAQAGVLL